MLSETWKEINSLASSISLTTNPSSMVYTGTLFFKAITSDYAAG